MFLCAKTGVALLYYIFKSICDVLKSTSKGAKVGHYVAMYVRAQNDGLYFTDEIKCGIYAGVMLSKHLES